MSAPETPSGDPISGRATPVSLSSANGPVSSIESSPALLPHQPAAQVAQGAQEAQPFFRPQVVSTHGFPALAPVLQPLPRGRPAQPKSPPPPPPPTPTLWRYNAPQLDTSSTPPASASPIVQPPPQFQSLPPQNRKPPPEPAYVRGGHLLGGYNTSRYPGSGTFSPKFNQEGRAIVLHGPSMLQAWVIQISYIGRSLSCFDELTLHFTSFPDPCTVQLFICETRFATAFRVLEATISGTVWAYMRVLGYSSIPTAGEGLMSPSPADCFEYAKLAASKINIPGTPEQPAEERKQMVHEILTAKPTDYPSDRTFKKGITWLRMACDNHIRQGDFELAQSLYDPLPTWAPRPPGYEEPTTPATSNGEVASLEQSGDNHGAQNITPGPSNPAETAGMADGSSSASAPTQPAKLVPPGQKSGKRKRAKKHVGSQAARPNNSTPANGSGA